MTAFMLTAAQWREIEGLFEPRSRYHQITMSAIIWLCNNRKTWPELPPVYGPHYAVKQRAWKMRQNGTTAKALARLGIEEWYPPQGGSKPGPRIRKEDYLRRNPLSVIEHGDSEARAKLIRPLRLSVRWTQTRLAKEIGVSAGYISMMEQGASICPLETLRKRVAAARREKGEI